MKIQDIHPIKKVIFIAAFVAGLISGIIFHILTAETEEKVAMLVATQPIEKDQRLLQGMFETRLASPKHLPTNLIPPENTDYFVGKKAKRPIEIGEPLQQHTFERNESP